jgi:dienelactone hydrolase
VPFTATYAVSSPCSGTTLGIRGETPAAAPAEGRSGHPVFVYLVGTNEAYTNVEAAAAVTYMARRGYVAAAVEYPASTSFGTCPTLAAKARCVFDPARPTSALAVLCARPGADCGRGVVVGGFSQGAVLALLARDSEPRVRAAWGMGAGVTYFGYELSACLAEGSTRALPASRIRVTNGEGDVFFGGSLAGAREQSQRLTGRSCPAADTCLAEDGSGWRLVRHAEVSDGSADHCYWRARGDCAFDNEGAADPAWTGGGAEWALPASLQWLSRFTDR